MNVKALMKGLWLLNILSVYLFVGFIVLNVVMFGGGGRFYAPLVVLVTGVILVFEVLRVYWPSGKSLQRKLFWRIMELCLLAVLGRVAYQEYHASFDVVDAEVNIRKYEPFREGSLVVTLEEPSSLRLQEELPRLDGATALYPLYAAFVQATYPVGQYAPNHSEVMCSKTGAAYERLISGESDIIFVARPSQAHLDMAAEAGVEMQLTPIGWEAFVFFVHAKNPLRGLRREQIQAIYSGGITNWRKLGGRFQAIRAFQRPENSGSQTMLQSLMEGKDLMRPPSEDVVAGMGGIIHQTANYRNYRGALGFSFRFFATEMVQEGEIRLLEVDGVAPTRENIANGSYPLTTNLYAVTIGSDNPRVAELLDWILSEQGQDLVRRSGYTPLNESKVMVEGL